MKLAENGWSMTLTSQQEQRLLGATDCSQLMVILLISTMTYSPMQRRTNSLSYVPQQVSLMHYKVSTNKERGIACWLSSLLSSRCAWILAIQMCLWGRCGGVCIGQWGENLRGFLKKIKGPFQKAFTKENIRKAFEMTRTQPVDCSKITATHLAPAQSLSIVADSIANLTSPVKAQFN